MKDNQAKYPQLRFKGFTDPWEQCKLSELSDVSTGFPFKSTDFSDLGDLLVVTNANIQTDSGYVDEDVGNRITINSDSEIESYELDPGDILVTMDGTVGRTAVVAHSGLILAQRVGRIVAKNNSAFLYQWLATDPFVKAMALQSHGGTIKHISLKEISNYEAGVPSLKEQEKLGTLLSTIDNTIALHQRKLAKLKKLKQGYLQKLFPQNGSKFPQLRFAGFADAWEQRKFNWMLDPEDGIRRGPFGSALKKSLFVADSPYAVYEQQNAIYDRFNTRYCISEQTFNKLRKFELHSGDFIMSGAGTIGRISRVPEGIKVGVFNQALIRFRVDSKKVSPKYFLQLIRSPQMQKRLTESNPGSAITNLVPMSEVKNWLVSLPSKGEQMQIAGFLDSLDSTIALHQRKLEKLQELKKGYLQKMFC